MALIRPNKQGVSIDWDKVSLAVNKHWMPAIRVSGGVTNEAFRAISDAIVDRYVADLPLWSESTVRPALIRERVASEQSSPPRTPDGTLMDSSGLADLMDASQVEPIRERVSHERSVGAVSPGTSIKVPLTYGSWG